jgi:hypothetical protein
MLLLIIDDLENRLLHNNIYLSRNYGEDFYMLLLIIDDLENKLLHNNICLSRNYGEDEEVKRGVETHKINKEFQA